MLNYCGSYFVGTSEIGVGGEYERGVYENGEYERFTS